MRTKKIELFYHLSTSEIFPPERPSLERKDLWIKEVQRTIPKQGETRIIKVTYELFNPEIDQQRKFFNGPVVDYYTIQSKDILFGTVPPGLHDQYRETILSDLLGYEVELINRKEKRRKSTGDFTSTQQWHDLLERIRETMFEPNGYEMPNSEAFWEIAKKYGYAQAKKICIKNLQKMLIAKSMRPHA